MIAMVLELSEILERRLTAVLCDMLGCREHATGEVQTGDEYIPLCELHRRAEMDRLTPKWRPLPPHPPSDQAQRRGEETL